MTASFAALHTQQEQRRVEQRMQIQAAPLPQKHESSRSRQRMQEIEMYQEELRRQEAKDCLMTEQEHQLLLNSFASVKFEFSDLDGLTWTALPTHQKSYLTSNRRTSSPRKDHKSFSPRSNSTPSFTYSSDDRPSKPTTRTAPIPLRPAAQDLYINIPVVDDDITPMSTPTQTDFHFPASRTYTFGEAEEESNSLCFGSVEKLILLDPSKDERKRFRVRLPSRERPRV